MSVLFLLVFVSLGVALLFLAAFVWAVKSGQYRDVRTPALRILTEDGTPPARKLSSKQKRKRKGKT